MAPHSLSLKNSNFPWPLTVFAFICALILQGCLRICEQDSDCDDGLYCNGNERCNPRSSEADRQGCTPGPGACLAGLYCSETFDRCTFTCGNFLRDDAGNIREGVNGVALTDGTGDKDGDGRLPIECGGLDCDDLDARRYPGATEVCDPFGIDEDCNPDTIGDDLDRDGFVSNTCFMSAPDGGTAVRRSYPDGSIEYYRGEDCDDTQAAVSPRGLEYCNGQDDDCDGLKDEGVLSALFVDADGDGFGNPEAPVLVCAAAHGYSHLPSDCDDTNPQLFPGSIRCTGATANAYVICQPDGTWAKGICAANLTCISQPGGQANCG